MISKIATRTSDLLTLHDQVDTAPPNIKGAKKQAVDSADDTEICLQCKEPIVNNLHAVSRKEWNTEGDEALFVRH
jgi:hypothetical protein